MLAEKSLEGQHHIARERYLTFSCEVDAVDGLGRLRLLHSCIRPTSLFRFECKKLLESNLTTKDFIAPEVMDFASKSAYR